MTFYRYQICQHHQDPNYIFGSVRPKILLPSQYAHRLRLFFDEEIGRLVSDEQPTQNMISSFIYIDVDNLTLNLKKI